MQFEYDPEKLIEEVRKRPGIWDFEDVNYRAKDIRHKLWIEVVSEMMQTDVMISKSEMRELELQLQKKWKSIRDCFLKYIQNPNRTRRPYIYCKKLQFLLKNQQSLPVEVEAASSESDDGRKRKRKVWKSKKNLRLIKDEAQTSDDDNGNDNDNFQEDEASFSNEEAEVSLPPKIPRRGKPVIDEFVFASVDNKSIDADDPDKMFLLSLLPHLKSIPEDFRLNAKMDIMQVLRNANYSASNDHKIM